MKTINTMRDSVRMLSLGRFRVEDVIDSGYVTQTLIYMLKNSKYAYLCFYDATYQKLDIDVLSYSDEGKIVSLSMDLDNYRLFMVKENSEREKFDDIQLANELRQFVILFKIRYQKWGG